MTAELENEVAEKGKPGRKKHSPEEARKTFSARMPPEWAARYDEARALRRMSQSAYLEYLTNKDRVFLGLDKEEKKAVKKAKK